MSKSIVIRHVNCKYGSPMGRSNERIGGFRMDGKAFVVAENI